MKNRHVQEVRDRLKKYKDFQAQYRIRMNKYLSAGDPYAGMSINYNSITPGSPTNKVSNRMEEALIKSDEDLWQISNASGELEELDIALEALGEVQEKIIRLKYIENKKWDVVADTIGYSESQAKKICKEALKRMADILYGQASYEELPLFNSIKEVC
ncbi:MAG: hypothetical protein ACRDDX_10490 [Cellulosilyticaceae bacterium]